MSSRGQFHLSRSIGWQLWAHGCMKPFIAEKMILHLKKKQKKGKTNYHPFCVCVCLLFLLHPEQSAAVHKASCYPRDGRLNESLKACVSSVRRAVLLKINLNIGFLLNYSIFLLMERKSTRKHSLCSSSTLDIFVYDVWFICVWTPTVVPLTYTPAVLRYVYKTELITAILGNCSSSKMN